MTQPVISNVSVQYTFTYDTPTQVSDGSGGFTTVNVPTSFSLGGIALDVAKGIGRGLSTVPTITNVTATRVRQATDTVTAATS